VSLSAAAAHVSLAQASLHAQPAGSRPRARARRGPWCAT